MWFAHLGKEVVGEGVLADGDGVAAVEARHGAAAVADVEDRVVRLVRRRLAVVVVVVERERSPLGLDVGDPEVGGAGVVDDVELLRRRAHLYLTEVLRILEVVDHNR